MQQWECAHDMRSARSREAGYLLIEVLITMFILAIGLLGVVGLQARAQQAETDSYQRTQGLDAAARHRGPNQREPADNTAGSRSADTARQGKRPDDLCSAAQLSSDRDKCAWSAALLGAAETTGTCDISTGANCVGAMIGARGCVTELRCNCPDLSDRGGLARPFTELRRRPPRSTCGINEIRRGRVNAVPSRR